MDSDIYVNVDSMHSRNDDGVVGRDRNRSGLRAGHVEGIDQDGQCARVLNRVRDPTNDQPVRRRDPPDALADVGVFADDDIETSPDITIDGRYTVRAVVLAI